jgi:hypothetical protein
MKKVRFTFHALDKSLHRYNLGKRRLEALLRYSVQIVPPRWVKKHNKKIYQKQRRYYFMNEETHINFVVLEKNNHFVVVTVFKDLQPHARRLEGGKKLNV